MPTLYQPFTSWQDSNEYAFPAGTGLDSFAGQDWTLSAGASITTATLADGTTGPVLNLPAGATATSPAMCVDSDFPDARLLIQNPSGTQGISVLAAYSGTGAAVASSYSNTGQGVGWGISPTLQTHPGNLSGWQLVVFTLEGTTTGTTKVYDFAVDPRMIR